MQWKDQSLFSAIIPYEGNPQIALSAEFGPRKLHEVCLNHKLANYLEKLLNHVLGGQADEFFVDIEFTRNGNDSKTLSIDGVEQIARPDIIIHNRLSGSYKRNFLVVECKKRGASLAALLDDRLKVESFMADPRYEYQFGLQVTYTPGGLSGLLFFRGADPGSIETAEIDVEG